MRGSYFRGEIYVNPLRPRCRHQRILSTEGKFLRVECALLPGAMYETLRTRCGCQPGKVDVGN